MQHKGLLLLILTFVVTYIGFSQSDSFGSFGNEVPSNCDCINFTNVCTGEPFVFNEGGVISNCNNTIFKFPLNFKGFEHGDSIYCKSNCTLVREEGICLHFQNWHICDFNGCDARIYQTLSNFPTINGQLLGNGADTSFFGELLPCIGREHSGDLNTLDNPVLLDLCPGDRANLLIPHLDISAESALCLEVSIKDLNNQLMSDGVYTFQDVSPDGIDITRLLSPLEFSTPYTIEMSLKCCSGIQSCTINTLKRAFFELSGSISFFPYITQGGLSTECDRIVINSHTEFPGPVFASPVVIDPSNPDNPLLRNCPITLLVRPINTQISKRVDVTIKSKPECDPMVEGDTILYIFFLPGQNYIITSISNGFNVECECYELELAYRGCDNKPIKDKYYYRIGDECVSGIIQNENLQLSKTDKYQIKTWPNPVNNELIIDMMEIPDEIPHHFNLSIFDMNGKQVHSSKIPANLGSISVPLNILPGTYLYVMTSDGFISRGKFIKQ